MVIGASETRWVFMDPITGKFETLAREEVWAMADQGWTVRLKRSPLTGYAYHVYRVGDGATEYRIYSAVVASPNDTW